jgi:gas vesicle protein
MADNGKFNGFALGFLIGAVAGIAIGFLYAPKPGRETRSMLREKAEEVTDRAKEIATEAGKRVRRKVEEK